MRLGEEFGAATKRFENAIFAFQGVRRRGGSLFHGQLEQEVDGMTMFFDEAAQPVGQSLYTGCLDDESGILQLRDDSFQQQDTNACVAWREGLEYQSQHGPQAFAQQPAFELALLLALSPRQIRGYVQGDLAHRIIEKPDDLPNEMHCIAQMHQIQTRILHEFIIRHIEIGQEMRRTKMLADSLAQLRRDIPRFPRHTNVHCESSRARRSPLPN